MRLPWIIFLFLFVFVFVAPTKALHSNVCGLRGTIKQRIHDCSLQKDSLKGNFRLVTRSVQMKEIRLDIISGLLWSEEISIGMDYDDAMIACSPTGQIPLGIDLQWRLPSTDDFRLAARNNIDSILEDKEVIYWTSTLVNDYLHRVFVFHFHVDDGKYFTMEDEYRRNSGIFVRCVAEVSQ